MKFVHWTDKILHEVNPLHVWCHLLDKEIMSPLVARRMCGLYEVLVYRLFVRRIFKVCKSYRKKS